MSVYVDGFVVPVPKDKLADNRRLARKFGKPWIQRGALAMHECAADEVKLKPDEPVVFSWIVFKSRRHRDAVNKKVMADPLLAQIAPQAMPFDGQRMFWGGFKELVRL
jgi:uncharacterized protein YbaA (DUF1428 family)